MSEFAYEPTYQFGADETTYRKVVARGAEELDISGRKFLRVSREALKALAKAAMEDVAFYLRKNHLCQLADELKDPAASDNDKFVVYTLLQNAVVAAKGELPMCQDTGTAIVMGKKGQFVLTDCDDAEAISEGIFECYQEKNLRYSQLAPLEMFKEKNTASNLPAQVDIMAEFGDHGHEYNFLFLAKGGGSANKTFLYQQSPAILEESALLAFVAKHIKDFGTSACPPYHVAVVIGGTSAEACLKAVKMASAKYLDALPTTGSTGGRAFRDVAFEKKVLELTRKSGIGAQFGGKFLAHDVRVIRLPRHAASCPIGMGVSCAADRNIKAKINKDGVWLEELERNPEKYLPAEAPAMAPAVKVNLDLGMEKVRALLSSFPVRTRVELTGALIVARDAAHARIKKMLDDGQPMPEYFKKYPIYYAGPAKTPKGMATGSFGPTTAGRMDGFVDLFQSKGGSMVMLAKGNRSNAVTDACKKWGGFYLGSIGGPAAVLAQNNIRKVEVVDFAELGMEAIRKVEVVDFPAFIVVDDKGNDFFAEFGDDH